MIFDLAYLYVFEEEEDDDEVLEDPELEPELELELESEPESDPESELEELDELVLDPPESPSP